jgi:pyruvate dehydrogenase E2 component (dihydrolipoamide acetyltransferase)
MSGPGGRIFATPFARSIALEKGIDLSAVKGTGPDGQIRADDVKNFTPAAVAAPAVSAAVPTSTDFEDMDLSNMRKVIADRLSLSKSTIPHYYLNSEINVEKILR